MAIGSAGANRRAWESRFGCCAALSLTVLEVKRLLLLALEMLVDSRAIRFAGALLPFIFSFVDVGLGLPVAVAALLAMRKERSQPCDPNKKRRMRRIACMLTICSILNAIGLLLIGCKLNPEVDSLRRAFEASMKLYARDASHKLLVDALQLELQCCGFSAHSDWFSLDWQGADYEDDSGDKADYGARGVPWSCCARHSVRACAHADVRDGEEDARTLNRLGCAIALGRLLSKLAAVGCAMTALIVCTQLVLIFALIRTMKRVMPDVCPSDCSCWEPSRAPVAGPIINSSSDECSSPKCYGRYRDASRQMCAQKPRRVCRRPRVAGNFCTSTASRCPSSRTTSCSSDDQSSSSSHARLTSSPSFPPKRTDEANRTSATGRVQRQLQHDRKLDE